MSGGNRAGSKVPYTGDLIGVPDVELLCAKCGKDWRTFPRTKGHPRGRVYEAEGVVCMLQPLHKSCNYARCKHVEGATVLIGARSTRDRPSSDSKMAIPSQSKMVRLFSSVSLFLPVSRRTILELEEKHLAAELVANYYKMLLWGAAGIMGAVVVVGVAVWVRTRTTHKKRLIALEEEVMRKQEQIETARSACLRWQMVSMNERIKTADKKIERERKEVSSTLSLRLHLAHVTKREQKAIEEIRTLAQLLDDHQRANDKLRCLAKALEADFVISNLGQGNERRQ